VNRVEEQVVGASEDILTLSCSPPVLSSAISLSLLFDTVVEADLEHAGADWYLRAHDDALGDALYAVFLALDGRVVQMIRCHFETSQHQHRLLHLLDSETGDAKDLTLVGHLIGKELDVTVINLNTILPDRELDFLNDNSASGFNTQH